MNKILGYFLTAVGLMMLFFALIAMYKVFTGGAEPAALIANFSFNMNTSYGPVGIDGAAWVKIINLFFHSLFMFFVAAAGGRVANIGVNLLKADAGNK